MKHQAINLVKFKTLSRYLEIPQCWTVGILESLWIFAQHNAKDGDLSRYSDDDIAGWIEYPGDATYLMDSLIRAKWVNEDRSIHDWQDHMPNWLKGVNSRIEFTQPSTEPSPEPSSEPGSEPSSAPSPEPGPQPPNLTQPNLTNTKPNLIDTPSKRGFDDWWVGVHRKVGKEAAKKAYQAAIARLKTEGCCDPVEFLGERMTAFAASPAARPTDHAPIHPATWLNQGRYHDDPETWHEAARPQSKQSAIRQNNEQAYANFLERHDGEQRNGDQVHGTAGGHLATRAIEFNSRDIQSGHG